MKYSELTLGEIENLIDMLGGPDGIRQLKSGELVVMVRDHLFFPIWKIIKLGTGLRSTADFRKALLAAGHKISEEWAANILGEPAYEVSRSESEVDLVNISVAELGFIDVTSRDNVYQRALALGLALCPPEIAPQLLLQSNLPHNERFYIGTEPITNPQGHSLIFVVGRRHGTHWIDVRFDRADDLCAKWERWIFMLPRKQHLLLKKET
jgi:hypothetical protein